MIAFERGFIALNRWLLILLLSTMSCIVFANVLLRYLTNESIVWGEEVARHTMIWLTVLGSGLVMRYGGHVAIDNFQDALPPRVAQAIRLFIVVALLIFFGAMVWFGHTYVERTMLQTTSATQIPFGYIYLAMPIGFAFMAIHLLLIARDLVTLRRYRSDESFDAQASAAL